MMDQPGVDVELGFKHIRYSEGGHTISFDREPGGVATPALVWVPSPKRWRETIPDWANGRRTEILTRLWPHAAGDEWRVFYATIDTVRDDDLSFQRRSDTD